MTAPLPAPFGPHDAAAFSEFAARMTATLAEYLATVRERPVRDWKPAGEILARWNFSPPAQGLGADAALAQLRDLIEDCTHLQHPHYMGHQVSAPVPAAGVFGLAIDILNPGMAVGEMAPAAATIEAALIRWLGGLAGLPLECAGYFTSGGTEANLAGLLAARSAKLGGEVWTKGMRAAPEAALMISSHAHYSISRTAGMLGLGTDSLITVPVNEEFRMTAAAAANALARARTQGLKPFALVASAGCTPTGTIDPLEDLAEFCEKESLWLHVDGAHGASLLLNPELAPRLRGIQRADSLAWDPHKMMSLPLGMGAVFTRDRGALLDAYRQNAPYIFHPETAGAALPNPGEISFQCSRPGDALKLWGILMLYGSDLFAEIIRRQCANAAALYEMLRHSDDFIPLHPPDTNILCFIHRPAAWRELPAEELGRRNFLLHEILNHSGEAWITSTVLNGRRVLRCPLMNPATTANDLEGLLISLRRLAKDIPGN